MDGIPCTFIPLVYLFVRSIHRGLESHKNPSNPNESLLAPQVDASGTGGLSLIAEAVIYFEIREKYF